MNNTHLVIMAGGIGSRFWPMSRPECPKQFIDVLGVGRTLLQLTVERFGTQFKPENIWVVTAEQYLGMVRAQLPAIPVENILLEPCMRNTAPCIAYVAWKIMHNHPNATLVISPADHYVVDTNEFRNVINKGISRIKGTTDVLTLGMKPPRPDTGYCYIQAAGEVDTQGVRPVNAFREKPNQSVAEQYLAAGGYYWNAGIFIWDARTAQAAIRHFLPDTAALFDEMSDYFYTADEESAVSRLFPQCEKISIDYAVMEPMGGKQVELLGRPARVYVMPSDFGWSDLGTWGSLFAQLPKDHSNNAIIGAEKISMIDSTNCIVRASGELRMVLQGLDNYIVAEDNGTLLICKKDQEQRIKEFSETEKC